MIKQGTVQETLADLNGNGSGALPPLHNLPHWSRVNNLDKGRYPKPFLKDRLQPLPNPSEMEVAAAISIHTGVEGTEPAYDDVQPHVARGLNSAQRIVHLEKSIYFIQQQHHEILSNLHEEIDKLKRENKELNFRIVMMQKSPSTPESGHVNAASNSERPSSHKDNFAKSHGAGLHRVPRPPSVPKHAAPARLEESYDAGHVDRHSQGSEEKAEELKIIFLEEEIKELKKALRDERSRVHHLQQLLERSNNFGSNASGRPERHLQATAASTLQQHPADVKPHSAGPRAPSQHPHPPASPRGSQEAADKPPAAPVPAYNTPPPPQSDLNALTPSAASQPLPYNASVNPLRVNVTNQAPRSPNLKECEVIVKHLQKVIDSQAHELNQLKTDLRDVLYSHKWTPDAFLLAKAYVAEDDAREMAEQSRLPKIELKHSTRKLPDMAYMSKDSLSLPALSQTMGNKAIERRKRHQILQKSRVNKELAN